MKASPLMLLWLSVTAGAFAADGTQASPLTPQPRPRLVQTSGIAATQAEPSVTFAPPAAVVLDRFVVRDAPLPGVPQPVTPDPKTFSFQDGGPFFKGKLGLLPFEAGLWTPTEIMPETAKFRAQKTHAEFDLLRLKF